jgi:hypothetical protein
MISGPSPDDKESVELDLSQIHGLKRQIVSLTNKTSLNPYSKDERPTKIFISLRQNLRTWL